MPEVAPGARHQTTLTSLDVLSTVLPGFFASALETSRVSALGEGLLYERLVLPFAAAADAMRA